MSLSLKAELETWVSALNAYDEQDFEQALQLFSLIADSSKILTNIGLIYATIGDHETAVEHFIAATNLDSYLAIAHFQCGVSNFLLEHYDVALLNFEDAYLFLRGNEAINYEQIGLKFKLFSAEILFNKGLAELNLGYTQEGLTDMQEASRQKVTDEHAVIDEAIRERGQGYTVFSIPVGVLYRPSENKTKNSKSKDYLGKAKLVAASDSSDAFTEFTGVKRLQQTSEANDKDDAEAEFSLTRSATVPAPRTEPIVARRLALERSKTTFQVGTAVRPNPESVLASRRSQSVSNPPPPPFAMNLSRSNSTLDRSNTTRLARNATTNNAVMPLRTRTPQASAAGVAGVGAGSPREGGDIGAPANGAPRMLRNQPSLRKLRDQVVPQVAHQSSSSSTPLPLQPFPIDLSPGKYMNPPQAAAPLVSPTMPQTTQEDGHFYDSYIDEYTDEYVSPPPISRPPTAQAQSNPSLLQQRQPPAAMLPYQQPQSWAREQQQLPSPVRTSSNMSASSGHSRAPSRAATTAMIANSNMAMNMNQSTGTEMVVIEPSTGVVTNTSGANTGKGGVSFSNGSLRRKPTRRPTMRRVPVYDDEGDDGFVNDELEMANIRVKLHYQGDVRGMTISPITMFDEFVERVTTKFGTSRTGLGMKFTDEDGTKITLRDESDFELAVETARENGKGKSEGKIEVWCVDI